MGGVCVYVLGVLGVGVKSAAFFVVKYFHSAGWAVYSLSVVVRSFGVQAGGGGQD